MYEYNIIKIRVISKGKGHSSPLKKKLVKVRNENGKERKGRREEKIMCIS